NDRGNNLVSGENRREATDREVEHAEQQKHQIRTRVCSGRVGSGLSSDLLKNYEIERGRDPKNEIKDQRAKKFREHNLPVTHGRGHERLDRAEFKFFCKQAHGYERKNQNKGKPEKDGIKKCLLHRVLDLALVHE